MWRRGGAAGVLFACLFFQGYLFFTANGQEMIEVHELATNVTEANAKIDLYFVVDGSSSIKKENFDRILAFMAMFLEAIDVGGDAAHVGVVQYNKRPKLHWDLARYDDKNDVLEAIKGIDYLTGVTHTGAAISYLVTDGFTRKKGDRPDAPNVAIVLTDGFSQDDVLEPARLARDNGITIIAVAVNPNQRNIDEMLDIAGGATDNVLFIDDYERIHRSMVNSLSGNGRSTPFRIDFSKDEPLAGHRQFVHTECKGDRMEVTFELPYPFDGTIYVRGAFGKRNCFRNFADSREINGERVQRPMDTYSAKIVIPYYQCGTKRSRKMNPLGTMYETTLVTMHSPPFLTQEDHAYHISCFYGEGEQTVSSNLQDSRNMSYSFVKDLPSSFVEKTAEPPDCAYHLRNGSPTGPTVRFATIGQTVYHVWECETDGRSEGLYSIKVHSCYVKSDSQDQHVLINENGCSVDQTIVDSPSYPAQGLIAFAESKAFKVPDSNKISFDCKISICADCESEQKPRCDGMSSRSKRSAEQTAAARNQSARNSFDLSSPWITVLPDVGFERFSDDSQLLNTESVSMKYICAATWKYTTGASCFIIVLTTNLIIFLATFCRRSEK